MRDEFLITRSGKQYVLFAGLLDEAHERGLAGIDTELVQAPSPDNGQVAVVKAVATLRSVDGETGEVKERSFGGIGDASPENVGRNIVPHLIRMAETRAKARALRDAVNVGATALEELSDGDDAPATRNSANGRASGSGSSAPRRESKNTTNNEPTSINRHQADRTQDTGQGSARKARKSQVDLLKTLAVELRGENGVERLEQRIGKPLVELSQQEASDWVDRLTPEEEAKGR